MRARRLVALAALVALGPARLSADEPKRPPPLDVREPPFGEFDFSWLNGSNRQPPSLLVVGPITLSLYADAYYQWQFWNPTDHTVFPSTVAPRHNELGVDLAAFGIDVTGLDGPIGRVIVQFASNTETTVGQDASTQRGFYLTNRAFQFIQQAAGGWHFHALHGVNLELGILPSYFSVESYLPQENWNYTHSFVGDSTPYYFSGLRAQLYLTRRMKLELWLMNGWQTLGQWHEARAGGYFYDWRPREWLQVATAGYVGQDAESDPNGVRIYTDHHAQVRFHHGRRVKSVAGCYTGDLGWEQRSNAPSGLMAALMINHRVEWTDRWATALRLDLFFDRTQAVIPQLPLGSPYRLPAAANGFLGGGVTVTQDFLPSPWLIVRLEYAHREANTPYFSGPGGITGPGGTPAANPSLFAPDLRTRDDRIVGNVTLRL